MFPSVTRVKILSSKCTRADPEGGGGTVLSASSGIKPTLMRLPEPDQSESDEIEPRLEPDDVVVVELFDPNELTELFDPNEPGGRWETVDTDERVALEDE